MHKVKNHQSKLSQKIISRFLLLEIIIFSLIIASLFLFLFPFMMRSASRKCNFMAQSAVDPIDNQLDSLYSYFSVIAQSQTLQELITQYQQPDSSNMVKAKIAIYLDNFSSSNPYCRCVAIRLENGERLSSISNRFPQDDYVFLSEEYSHISKGTKYSWISPIYVSETQRDSLTYSIAYSNRIKISNTTAVVTFFSDITGYFDNLSNLTPDFFSQVSLFDTFGNPLYTKPTDLSLPKSTTLSSTVNHKSTFERGGYYTVVSGNNNRCTLTGYASPSLLMQDFIRYFIAIFLITLGSFIATVRIFLPMLSRNLHPLLTLNHSMRAVMNGDTAQRPVIHSGDEIEDLSNIYNSMLDTLDNRTELLINKEKEKNQLRFSLIISQIDPHFIFNTMNIISVLAKQKRCDDIQHLNSALINLLRDRLRISETEFLDTIQHEIDITKEYIKIVQFRTDMHVVFHWKIPDQLSSMQIPKNILQPIIENTLIHGLYDVNTGEIKGNATISFQYLAPSIFIEITDDGIGITEDALLHFYTPSTPDTDEERGKHIGLKNIQKRLALIYESDDARIDICNVNPHGTKVTLKLPINRQ